MLTGMQASPRKVVRKKLALVFMASLVLIISLPTKAASFNDPYTCYDSYTQIEARVSDLVASSAGLAHWEVLGQSFAGRQISVLRMGNPAPGTPQLVLVSNLDGNDFTGVQTSLAFAEWLLGVQGNSVQPLLELAQLHFILVANPDGRVMAESQLYPSGLPSWLGNTNLNSCNRGVRLERNFPTDNFPSNSPCDQNFSGSGRLSEAESQVINSYLGQVFGPATAVSEPAEVKAKGMVIHLLGNTAGWTLPAVSSQQGVLSPAPGAQELALKLASQLTATGQPQIDSYETQDGGSLHQAVYERYGVMALTLRMRKELEAGVALPIRCSDSRLPDLEAEYIKLLNLAALAAFNPLASAYGPEITHFSWLNTQESYQLRASASSFFEGLSSIPISRIKYAFGDLSGNILGAWTQLQTISDPSFSTYQEGIADIPKESIPLTARFIFLRAVNQDGQFGITQISYLPDEIPAEPELRRIYLPVLYR